MHACMFLPPVYRSLRWSAIFGLALYSAALISLGRQGVFSSHIFPVVYITVGYLTSLDLFILKGYFSNTLDFRKNLEDSAPFLGVPLSFVSARRFPEEAPKLSENFTNRLHALCLIYPI